MAMACVCVAWVSPNYSLCAARRGSAPAAAVPYRSAPAHDSARASGWRATRSADGVLYCPNRERDADAYDGVLVQKETGRGQPDVGEGGAGADRRRGTQGR